MAAMSVIIVKDVLAVYPLGVLVETFPTGPGELSALGMRVKL